MNKDSSENIPQLNINQQIIGYSYQMLYGFSGEHHGRCKIRIDLQDGGTLEYFSSLEEVETLQKHLKNKTPAVITIGSL